MASVACDAPPVHPAPKNTCEASVVHMVMQNTASAEANTLLHSNTALMVPVPTDVAPRPDVIEQMPVDSPLQLSTVNVPPSQDISSLITNLNSTISATVGTALQPLTSWLSSLESSMQAKATLLEVPLSPSRATGLWGQPLTSGPAALPHLYHDQFELDDAAVHGFHPRPSHIPSMDEDNDEYAEFCMLQDDAICRHKNEIEQCYCIIHRVPPNTSTHALSLNSFSNTFNNFHSAFPGRPTTLTLAQVTALGSFLSDKQDSHWKHAVQAQSIGIPAPPLEFPLPDIASHTDFHQAGCKQVNAILT